MGAKRILGAAIVASSLALGSTAANAGEVSPLFADDSILEVTIEGPVRKLIKDRPLDEDLPARLIYRDAEKGEQVLDIGIRTRGRYRQQSDVCLFPPLRLNFKKDTRKGTLFDDTRRIKMVTHCQPRTPSFQQRVVREYLAYRVLNQLTDYSYRVRLLRVTYVDTEKGDTQADNFAFLIEHNRQVAKRIDLKLNDADATTIGALDAAHTNVGSLFQYLIGNTDFSPIKALEGERCCHNYALFGDQPGNMYSIPYDFDMSGFVDAPYAQANPRFRLGSVRDRLYRGRCANDTQLDASVQLFIDRRDDILKLLEPDFLSKKTKRELGRYINRFYQTIMRPRDLDRKIRSDCIGPSA